MLAREYAQKRKKDVKRPVILSHHMLLGLKQVKHRSLSLIPESSDSTYFVEPFFTALFHFDNFLGLTVF